MFGLLALALLTILLFYKVWMHQQTIGGYDDEGTVVRRTLPPGHEAVNVPRAALAIFASPAV